eukprot:TRINITY_DN43631_c0_g1_i1.p1 TRINITY_DN43631_c0_g1~~TRINITY_DN43631_c0_g1_i1.p1  ORF type:complete len:190 (-),score=32.74 TRINITY_DN43631_c0_g1_i1:42-611(-)
MMCCSCDHREAEDSQHTIYVPSVSAEAKADVFGEMPRFSDVSSMSQAEKTREKARLQEMVKAFAAQAVYGVECQMVNLLSGQVAPARYVFDRQLREMKITPHDAAIPETTREIGRITTTMEFSECAAKWLTPTVQDSLTEEQRSRLILVQFDQAPMVCLLMMNVSERERWVMCTKILRLYAQTRPCTAE